MIGGPVRTLGFALALLGLAVFLTLAGPVVQELPLHRECAGLGGALSQSTEEVEPLVVSRTVFRCLGPGGQVLKSW